MFQGNERIFWSTVNGMKYICGVKFVFVSSIFYIYIKVISFVNIRIGPFTLTIIRCFKKWDVKLRNVEFEIRIDNKNLEYFMTVKKLTERQIKWFLILPKYDTMINYISGKNNQGADVFSKREQNVPETGDDKLEYKITQLLKPGMLNIEIKPENFIKIKPIAAGKNGIQFQSITVEFQPVGTGKNEVDFQPIPIETPENELENL